LEPYSSAGVKPLKLKAFVHFRVKVGLKANDLNKTICSVI